MDQLNGPGGVGETVVVDASWCRVPFPGESVAGDRAVVVAGEGQRALVAAIDGAGHGVEAAAAAEKAARVFEQGGGGALQDLIAECHAKLAGSRGATLAVLSLMPQADGRMLVEWAGVGDVEGVFWTGGQARHLVSRAGILGYESRIARLRPRIESFEVRDGDLAVLATDGLDPGFRSEHSVVLQGLGVHEIATTLTRKFRKGTDDSLVIALRVSRRRGGGPGGPDGP